MYVENWEKTGFLKQAPNVFTSSRNDGEWRAHYKSELRGVLDLHLDQRL